MGSTSMRLSRLLFAALLFAAPAVAKEPQFRGLDHQAMTLALGRFPASEDCGPRCADFIVARGEITGLEYLKLLVAHVRAGSRPLPLIIHSPGGNIDVARAMGDIMAKVGMTVVVARAQELPCARGKPCANDEVKPFRLIAGGAGCASACAMAIAGAPRRIVPEGAGVGVHLPHIPDEKKPSDEAAGDLAQKLAISDLRRYYAKYGIKSDIMDLVIATPPDEMRWLTRAELRDLGFIDDQPQSLPRRDPAAAGSVAPGTSVPRQRP